MTLRVLGSSSSGNCYLLQSETTGEVLAIEAGIKFDKVKQALDFDVNSVVGCIVSHEHGDHAKSVPDFINACIPCYMSQGTNTPLDFPITGQKECSHLSVCASAASQSSHFRHSMMQKSLSVSSSSIRNAEQCCSPQTHISCSTSLPTLTT